MNDPGKVDQGGVVAAGEEAAQGVGISDVARDDIGADRGEIARILAGHDERPHPPAAHAGSAHLGIALSQRPHDPSTEPSIRARDQDEVVCRRH
jgi:hypothetical protein